MSAGIIVHVSEVNISPESGMGRVEYYWKQAFERAGYEFIHIGAKEVGRLRHPSLFPSAAWKYYKQLNSSPTAFIVHEPASGSFVKRGIPCFLESHGVERRYWEAQLDGSIPVSDGRVISAKTKLLFPLWRLRNCDKGLKRAEKLLLINSDDTAFVKNRYKRKEEDILIFKNGIRPVAKPMSTGRERFTVLFNGSWIGRKGVQVLVKAAQSLHEKGLTVHYLLIGTGKEEAVVLNDWPPQLHSYVTIVPHFKQEEEPALLASADLFVLPSYFEGQPLSLLQAMAAEKCCIATNCCGQKDIIENNQTGFLFPPGDENALALAIGNCYANPGLVARIGNNAKEQVQHRTWENVSDEVVKYVTGYLHR